VYEALSYSCMRPEAHILMCRQVGLPESSVRESRRTAAPTATSSADGGVSRSGGGGEEVIVVEASGLDASEELHVIWALTESVACGEGLKQVRYVLALPVKRALSRCAMS
jgi:hypothetical protein